MTGVNTGGIEIDREFAASPAAVFAAFAEPESFAHWFGGTAVQVPLNRLDFVAEPGRSWTAEMVLPDDSVLQWAGDFVEVVPDHRLVFTITDRPAEPHRATVVVELVDIPAGTCMRFTQETPGFSPEQQQAVLAGWQSFIDELEQLLETPAQPKNQRG